MMRRDAGCWVVLVDVRPTVARSPKETIAGDPPTHSLSGEAGEARALTLPVRIGSIGGAGGHQVPSLGVGVSLFSKVNQWSGAREE